MPLARIAWSPCPQLGFRSLLVAPAAICNDCWICLPCSGQARHQGSIPLWRRESQENGNAIANSIGRGLVPHWPPHLVGSGDIFGCPFCIAIMSSWDFFLLSDCIGHIGTGRAVLEAEWKCHSKIPWLELPTNWFPVLTSKGPHHVAPSAWDWLRASGARLRPRPLRQRAGPSGLLNVLPAGACASGACHARRPPPQSPSRPLAAPRSLAPLCLSAALPLRWFVDVRVGFVPQAVHVQRVWNRATHIYSHHELEYLGT